MLVPEGFVDVTAIRRPGVYMLLWRGEVVYVGQAVKLHSRVSNHIHGQAKRKMTFNGRSIRGTAFDQVLVMPLALSDLDRVERELIERYIPKYNIRHKPLPEDIAALVSSLIVATAPAQPQAFIRRRL